MTITKQKIYLFTAGAVLALVGSYISLTPTDYLNQFGLTTGANVNFYSDLRSMGGSLLIFGLLAIAGSLNEQLQASALFTTSLIFAAYGSFRVVAVVLDGAPSFVIFAAAAIEILFAFLGYLLISKSQKSSVMA